MKNLAALLKPRPTTLPRSSAQLIQSQLFQASGQLARLRMNAQGFCKTLQGADLLVGEQFVGLVRNAEKKNKAAMQNIPKTSSLPY